MTSKQHSSIDQMNPGTLPGSKHCACLLVSVCYCRCASGPTTLTRFQLTAVPFVCLRPLLLHFSSLILVSAGRKLLLRQQAVLVEEHLHICCKELLFEVLCDSQEVAQQFAAFVNQQSRKNLRRQTNRVYSTALTANLQLKPEMAGFGFTYTSSSWQIISASSLNHFLTSGEKRSAAPESTAFIRQNLTLGYSEARQSTQEFSCSQPDDESTGRNHRPRWETASSIIHPWPMNMFSTHRTVQYQPLTSCW